MGQRCPHLAPFWTDSLRAPALLSPGGFHPLPPDPPPKKRIRRAPETVFGGSGWAKAHSVRAGRGRAGNCSETLPAGCNAASHN
eukprot:5017820-Alexandrium_andersonii.AAC.1